MKNFLQKAIANLFVAKQFEDVEKAGDFESFVDAGGTEILVYAEEPLLSWEEKMCLQLQDAPCEIIYPECCLSTSKSGTLKQIAKRIMSIIEDNKLYLDPAITLTKIARIAGSNRTYVSNVFASVNGYNSYMNNLKIKHLYNLLMQKQGNYSFRSSTKRRGPAQVEDSALEVLEEEQASEYGAEVRILASQSGFADLRTLKRALLRSESRYAKALRQRICLP
ncbi:MAG: hypothetical protein IKI67_03540 [Bacteroidales bacterium]|nr:hypothetical protein [Bacteroidales bacterium]